MTPPRAFLTLFFALTACLTAIPWTAHADVYDTMRLNWFNHLTGGTGYDATDPDVVAATASINSTANSEWMLLKNAKPFSTTCFTDLAFGTKSANATTAYSRLADMTRAYWAKGGGLYQSAALKVDIITALDWLYANTYNETKTEYDNWWDWEIGVPLNLDPTVTMLYDSLTATQIANYMKAIDHFTPSTNTTGGGAGANGAWAAIIVGVRAVIVKDPAKLQTASNTFSTLTALVTSGDGYFSDGSYLGHAYYSYTGGYGFYFLQSLADGYYLMGNGTPYPLPDSKRAVAYNWVKNSYWTLLYRGQTPYFSIGREVGRGPSGNRSGSMSYTISELTGNDTSTDAVTLRQMAKSIFLDGGSQYPTSIGPLVSMKSLVTDSSVFPLPAAVSTTIFPVMAKAVTLRTGWGVGIAFYSTKIYDYEDAGENKRGWHQSDGMVYLNNADADQFNDVFWPTVNNYRLPGTTVTQNTATAGGRANGSTFAGGADLGGRYGAVGFNLKPGNGQTLVANKAWFTFDDEVVCLGSGITSTDSKIIETVIENRRLNSAGSNALKVDGTTISTALPTSTSVAGAHWMHLAGSVAGSDIGYVFPTPTTLDLLRETHTGAWSDLRTGSSSTTLSGNYLTATVSHGTNPANASYAYILLPNYTAAQVASYAATPQVTVMENDSYVSAATETTLGASGAVFWQDVSYQVKVDNAPTFVSSDKKAVVMTQRNNSQFTVTVSDPTQANTGVINVEITQPVTSIVSVDSGVSVTQFSPTLKLSVSVSGAKGKTFHATFGGTVPSDTTQIPITAVSASADDGNVASNTLDNNFNTRWSAQGDGQWIQYDFPQDYLLSSTAIAYYAGNQRTSGLDVQTSFDGLTWTTIFSGTSSGTTTGLQPFVFTGSPMGRHVKIIGHGNSQGTGWNSITEVQWFGSPVVALYDDWAQTNFTAAQLADPTISGLAVCPAGDCMTNLMKYSQGLPPLTNTTASGGGPSTQAASDHLQVTYVKMKNATDLTYTVQVSGDLMNWYSGQGYTDQVSAIDLDANRRQMIVRDNATISAGVPRFMRLVVSK